MDVVKDGMRLDMGEFCTGLEDCVELCGCLPLMALACLAGLPSSSFNERVNSIAEKCMPCGRTSLTSVELGHGSVARLPFIVCQRTVVTKQSRASAFNRHSWWCMEGGPWNAGIWGFGGTSKPAFPANRHSTPLAAMGRGGGIDRAEGGPWGRLSVRSSSCIST